MNKFVATALFALTLITAQQSAQAGAREEARLIEASGVLEELLGQRDTLIPERLLSRAYGIAVIPNVVKVAAVVGGKRGSGVMVVRDSSGRFSDPILVSLTGGNVGWQIGVQSADIVLVFTTRKSIEGITDGKLTLGADASVAAGPVGRAASAATDQNFKAEVYSYSRASGLFAGVAIDGSIISIDSKANTRLYGRKAPAADIIAGTITTNLEAAKRFQRIVLASTGSVPASAGATTTSSPAIATPTDTVTDTSAAVPRDTSQGAVTYPLEDANPGAEPPQ